MSDEQKSPEAAPNTFGAAASDGPTDLEILKGGVEIDVVKIDKSSERVKVRILPYDKRQTYGDLMLNRDEASLAELLCGKSDRTSVFNLQNALGHEQRLLTLLRDTPPDKAGEVEQRLTKVREEISSLESKPRWANTLTEASMEEILSIGERLNAKNHARFVARREAAAGRMFNQVKESQEKSSSQSSGSSAE